LVNSREIFFESCFFRLVPASCVAEDRFVRLVVVVLFVVIRVDLHVRVLK